MPVTLPPTPQPSRNIAGVASLLFGALRGGTADLPRARSVVLVVVDGLGAIPLRAHAGHARTLTAAMARRDVTASVFPTTTAAALTSILTGRAPAAHGLVGYRVLDPSRGALLNHLGDWQKAGVDPRRWQPLPTIFEQARAQGHPAFALGIADYARSGFTGATLRGAQFVAAPSAAERVALAYELAATEDGALIYCYLPDVDKAGHKHGVDSTEWVAALEDVDAALSRPIPEGVGVLVTADHGMVDVPSHRQLVLDSAGGWYDGVRMLGGEPRMMHVYLEPDADHDAILARWRRDLQGSADVVSKRQALQSGLLGEGVTDAARGRTGDLLVIARSNVAIYDGEAEDQRGRSMVGQHGGLTDEEWRVPLIRMGAFSR